MNNDYLKNGLRFLLLFTLQLFVLNQLSIRGFLIPYVYLLFVLLLPFNTGKSWLLILGFGAGITMDVFGNTPGLHAAATTLLAFARPGVIRLYFPRLEFTEHEQPDINQFGALGFLKYSFSLVFIHHTALFLLEIFNLHHPFKLLWHIAANSLYSTAIVFILVLFFIPRKR